MRNPYYIIGIFALLVTISICVGILSDDEGPSPAGPCGDWFGALTPRKTYKCRSDQEIEVAPVGVFCRCVK